MSGAKGPAAAKAKVPGIRQTMSDLHIWTGLLVGWVLYAMFLTGTVSYFRDEISQWMRPEAPTVRQVPDAAVVSERIVASLGTLAASSPQWSFQLPDARTPTVSSFWRKPGPRRAFESATFDPATGQKLAVRETQGGDFFFRFHFDLHYLPAIWARWIVGFCAMFMLVAIVSGVITHKKIFVDFFTFRWGKGQRSWLDAHTALSVIGLPFHFMITYSGLVTLMLLYMPWSGGIALKTPEARQSMTAQLSAFPPPPKAAGQAVPLVPVGPLVRQAQARWGEGGVGSVNVTNPGDASAQVVVVRSERTRVATSPQYMLFGGADGRLIRTVDEVGAAAQTRGVLYGLHIGRFADGTLRWLYFIVSLAGTAMVGTGLVLWTVKRRQKLPDPDRPYFGFRLVERLNIATIAGLSTAMAAMLWANRLLPAGVADRAKWEIHVFFIVWALTLVYAVARPARRAWIELLWLATAAIGLLPVLNALTTDRGLPASLRQGDGVYVALELTLLALAALHAMLAIRTARHRPRVRVPKSRRDVAGEPGEGVAA